MARYFKKRTGVIGLAPGALVLIGNQKMEKPLLRLIDYTDDIIQESVPDNLKDLEPFKTTKTVSWINIDGLHQTDLIKESGELFNLHPLLLEDVLNTAQRAKMAEFDNCLFFSLKMLQYNKEEQRVTAEQLAIVVQDNFLLTFQEQTGDVFDPVRERLRKKKGRIRKSNSDYLAYALLDTVVDNYISILENIGEQIEELEQKILTNPNKKTLEEIYSYKQEIIFLAKTIKPAREMINRFVKAESDYVSEKTRPFIRDLYDLITHTTETIDVYRDLLTDYLNLYHTGVSNKMNEIMKVLTIFAAIFIPLTFVAGIYGTNFDYLPELHYKYSYFIFWGVIILIASVMLIYFKIKKWF